MKTVPQNNIRQPAVAGMFYPSDAGQLHTEIAGYLETVAPDDNNRRPVAIIAPHAGYIYSGAIAASAYTRLLPFRGEIKRVILLGPSHRVPFRGLAASSANYFSTPLGNIPLDRPAIDKLVQLQLVNILDEAHTLEHSLEVQLPFLQEVLDSFTLIPLVVGDADPEMISRVLDVFSHDVANSGSSQNLIVISSDLSHYHDYSTARQMDSTTSKNIESLNWQAIDYEDACGRAPITGLIEYARINELTAKTIDLRNSGDTAGTKEKVVGYGAYVFE